MQEQHTAHSARLEKLLRSVPTNYDIRARSTLFRFYKNCREIYVEMDKEMVNCRRHGQVTLKYTELEVKYLESVNTFEQWTMMAALMY